MGGNLQNNSWRIHNMILHELSYDINISKISLGNAIKQAHCKLYCVVTGASVSIFYIKMSLKLFYWLEQNSLAKFWSPSIFLFF